MSNSRLVDDMGNDVHEVERQIREDKATKRYFPSRRIVRDENGKKRVVSYTCKRTGPKIGRNEPCPCGSGRKFKRCCWMSL